MTWQAKTSNVATKFWDSPITGDEFFRILLNLSGLYVLYRCKGLAANGVTPLKMYRMQESKSIRKLKNVARELSESFLQQAANADYSHVRLPYKD